LVSHTVNRKVLHDREHSRFRSDPHLFNELFANGEASPVPPNFRVVEVSTWEKA
jgi:hypothetical protein